LPSIRRKLEVIDLRGSRRRIERLGLVLASTLLALTAAEVAIRVLDIGPLLVAVHEHNYQLSANPLLGYELKPGSTDGDAVTVNADGMRDHEYSVAKPASTFRIAMIGDSVAFGLGVTGSETVSSKLETLLSQHFSGEELRFEVLNFGVTGYNATQIIENLRSRALKYGPDLVLYLYCLNDPEEYSFEMEHLLALMTPAQESYWSGLRKVKRGALGKSRLYLLARYAARTRLRTDQRQHPAPVWDQDDPQWVSIQDGSYVGYFSGLYLAQASWAPLAAAFDALASGAVTGGAAVRILIVPLLHHLEEYRLSRVHIQLRTAFSDRALPFLDFLPLFAAYERREREAIGWDALHLTAEGSEFAAVATLYDLLAVGALPGLEREDFGRILESTGASSRYARLVLETVG